MRKINSESKFDDNQFMVKVCTTDKRNPETIYIEIGTYIKPLTEDHFSERMKEMEKSLNKSISLLLSTKNKCKKDFIFVTDIASERMMAGKKSFFDAQLYMKPTAEVIKTNKGFKSISEVIKNEYIGDVITMLKENISSMGFECSKSKN